MDLKYNFLHIDKDARIGNFVAFFIIPSGFSLNNPRIYPGVDVIKTTEKLRRSCLFFSRLTMANFSEVLVNQFHIPPNKFGGYVQETPPEFFSGP